MNASLLLRFLSGLARYLRRFNFPDNASEQRFDYCVSLMLHSDGSGCIGIGEHVPSEHAPPCSVLNDPAEVQTFCFNAVAVFESPENAVQSMAEEWLLTDAPFEKRQRFRTAFELKPGDVRFRHLSDLELHSIMGIVESWLPGFLEKPAPTASPTMNRQERERLEDDAENFADNLSAVVRLLFALRRESARRTEEDSLASLAVKLYALGFPVLGSGRTFQVRKRNAGSYAQVYAFPTAEAITEQLGEALGIVYQDPEGVFCAFNAYDMECFGYGSTLAEALARLWLKSKRSALLEPRDEGALFDPATAVRIRAKVHNYYLQALSTVDEADKMIYQQQPGKEDGNY